MVISEYKNATIAENWDTVKEKGTNKIKFTTWNPCSIKATQNYSIGKGAGQNLKCAFTGKSGYVQSFWRDEKTGILYVTVDSSDGINHKYKCLNSKRYSNQKYVNEKTRVDL